MDPSHLTQKSQEALHDAQTKALRFGHTEVDGEHLLLALLDQQDGIVPRLLAQAGAEPDQLRTALEAELARRPKVTGPGAAPGQVHVTQRLARLLDAANQEADRLKDEYVSVEHLVMALLDEGSATAAGRLLQADGLTSRYCRRSVPLTGMLAGFGLELAGRAGARLALLLGIVVHPSTVLRLVTALPGPGVAGAPEGIWTTCLPRLPLDITRR